MPKQWKHWCKMAGLRPNYAPSARTHWGHYNLTGRGRVWRVNCIPEFECSCPTEHFDRWANSRGAQYPGIPTTEKEFRDIVKRLIRESVDAK